jgi:hypothetical protein
MELAVLVWLVILVPLVFLILLLAFFGTLSIVLG